MQNHTTKYLTTAMKILDHLDHKQIDQTIEHLSEIKKQNGRLFFLGVGGSAANCIHAVNDFRKLCGMETYSPAENIAELTARTNDEGWETVFVEWLKISRLSSKDGIFVLSVGGGNREKNISTNLITAIDYARSQHAKILGIVGRDGGYTAKMADSCIVVPPIEADLITPLSESFQAVLWHLIASDPRLMVKANKWESVVSDKKL